MDLLFISSTFPRKNHDFLGIFVKRQVDALISLGCKVKVLCPVRIFPPKSLLLHPFSKNAWTIWYRLIRDSNHQYHNIYYVPYTSPPYPWFRAFGGLFFLIINGRKIFHITKNIDGVFSNFIFDSGLIGTFISKVYGIPHYLSIHENIHKQYSKVFIWKYMARYVLLNADIIYVNSNSTKKTINDFCPKEIHKVKLLSLGVQNNYFLDLSQKPVLTGQVKVVAISHFVKNKNIDIIIKSVVKLKSVDKLNIKLTIIGDGEEYDNLLKIVNDTRSEEYIKFVVHPKQIKIIDIFMQSNIIIQVAGHETFGLAVAEGIASGLFPVVSRASGIVDEFTSLGGVLQTVDTITVPNVCLELNRAIKYIYKKSIVEVLKENQKIIKEHYNWDESANYIMSNHRDYSKMKGYNA